MVDSASFAAAIHSSFFPGGQTPVKRTSASVSRPMVGQTLSARTLSDVINGDAFFRSPKYAIAAMTKTVSSSLNTLITGSGSIASAGTVDNPIVTVPNPENQGEVGEGSKLVGGAAMNKIIANSLAGKNFASSFVSQSINNLEQINLNKFKTESGGGSYEDVKSDDRTASTETQSGGFRSVAFTAELSAEEKGWYEERIALLKSKYPNDFKDTNFIFDIPNKFAVEGVTVFNGEDTYFPDAKVGAAQRIISKETILQEPNSANAYVCPALIELILLLHEKGILITGSFDAGRQWGMDLNDKSQLWLSDHSSGRAVDISSVGKVNVDPVKLGGGVTRDVYDVALELLLDTFAEVPQYLMPDLLCIHHDYINGYGVDNTGNNDAQTCTFKISRPWLEYVNFFVDTKGNHGNHIHLSFSGMRAGKYTGPGGVMNAAGMLYDNYSQDSAAPPGMIYIPGIGTFPDTRVSAPSSSLTKNYYGDWGANLGQQVVYEMMHTTVCSKEVAAIIAAIAARESGGGNPTSCNPNTLTGDYMSIGIFQINMSTGAHGKKVYELTEGVTKEKIQGWQIASKNWATVFPGEEPPTIDNYDKKLDEKNKFYRAEAESQGKTGNARFNYVVEKLRELVDHRAWIPNNQAYMFYTVRTAITPYYNFPKLGMIPETGYQYNIFGDGYRPPYGWLFGGVKFDDAVAVYENDGGTRASLKQWVKDVYAKDASCQLDLVANFSAKWIDTWLDGAVYE